MASRPVRAGPVVYGCIEVLRWSKPGIEERVLEVTKAAGWPELAAEALIALLDQLDASAADTDGPLD